MSTINKIRLVQEVEGQLIVNEVARENMLEAFSVRGYEQSGVETRSSLRAELQGMPKFKNLCGPMFDGDAIRYESREAYATLAQ